MDDRDRGMDHHGVMADADAVWAELERCGV
jgi:hypothetical protein